jgi:hypothetical protein
MSLAIAFVILIEIYYAATTLFDVSPFNGAKYFTVKERLTEWVQNTIIFGLPFLRFIFPAAREAGVIAYGILLIGEYVSWWHGYFFKPAAFSLNFYNKATRNTILVLSEDKDRFQPNLEHIILHILTLITFILLLLDHPFG